MLENWYSHPAYIIFAMNTTFRVTRFSCRGSLPASPWASFQVFPSFRTSVQYLRISAIIEVWGACSLSASYISFLPWWIFVLVVIPAICPPAVLLAGYHNVNVGRTSTCIYANMWQYFLIKASKVEIWLRGAWVVFWYRHRGKKRHYFQLLLLYIEYYFIQYFLILPFSFWI